jgi:hypothetical protein
MIGKPARVSELHTLLLKLTAPKTVPVLAPEITS